MRNIIKLMRRAPKHIYALMAILTAVMIVPAALYAWGPQRQTFTIEKPAPYVEFNSITNNPNIGDERNFVGIRENGSTGAWQDSVKVQSGKEYVVRLYVHNNAASNLNLVARDVNAMVYLPTDMGTTHQVNGFIRSSNAHTKEVYDHATFTGDSQFRLKYVAGSAKYYNNANGNGFAIPESLFTASGAKLGYDKMDGNIPGCFQYAGYLTFIVRPELPEAPKPDFTIQKEVRQQGGKFTESVQVKPGETVRYRINFTNTGNTQLNNVVIKDSLPENTEFVPGSVMIMNASNPNGAKVQNGDDLFTKGVNIGSYTAGSNALVVFDAKIATKSLVCGKMLFTNTASAQPEGSQSKSDTAEVTVHECDPPKPPVQKIYTCDGLAVQQNDRTHFTFDTKYTTKNTEFKKVVYVVKDASGKIVSESTDAHYMQTTPGTYTVEAKVIVVVDGKEVAASTEHCRATFTVKEEQKPGVKITKQVNGAEHADVSVDEPFTYTLVVKNTGNVDLKNVVVYDKAPDGVVFQKSDKGAIANNTLSYTIPALLVNDSETITITAIAHEYKAGTIKNTACVNAPEVNPGDPNKSDDCDDATIRLPEPKHIWVCEKETGKITEIDEKEFNESKHDKDTNSCKIKVCVIEDKVVTIIDKDKFNEDKHTTGLEKCTTIPTVPPTTTTPTPETPAPTELPRTGADVFIGGLGLSSLVTATVAYVASRRSLIG